jgi:hypothetical protein
LASRRVLSIVRQTAKKKEEKIVLAWDGIGAGHRPDAATRISTF